MVRPAKEESSRSGDLLNDAYELHELLESDGDQHTYRATDTRDGSSVQIKLLRPELALQSGAVQRFLKVPKTLSGLRHPNLSQVIAIESDELGIPFVVEEHVQGEPLGKTVASFPQGIGALLYQTLGGQTIDRPGARHEPLDELAPHLPGELTDLVERCLRKDPAARPASAVELRDALGAAADRLRGVDRKSTEVAAPPTKAQTPAPAKPAPVKPAPAKAATENYLQVMSKPEDHQRRIIGLLLEHGADFKRVDRDGANLVGFARS
jgi:serine/threonine protein kinase